MKINKNIVVTAALLTALTIMIGAFGAHGLKELISEKSLVSFETGVRYQMYHVIVMLVLGLSTRCFTKNSKMGVSFFYNWNAIFLWFYLSTSIKRLIAF